MTELHDLTALQQGAEIRARRVSASELVSHYLDRIQRLDADLGAFLTVTSESALAQAARCDDVLGSRNVDGLPVLFGVPIAIKDLTAVSGVRFTCGSAALAEVVATHDDPIVSSMSEAGLISLGKTNVPEFGVVCYTANDLVREAVTPWDLGRSAAGSSGGGAVAVAAGLVPVAQGSDAAGSVRSPASVCGLVGVKPSRGLVSPAPDAQWLAVSTSAPLARTVRDAAALLDVLAGPTPGDLFPLHRQVGDSFVDACDRSQPRLVVGRFETAPLGAPLDAECAAAVDQTAKLLTELGHAVEPIDYPASTSPEQLEQAWICVFGATVAATVRGVVPPERRDVLRPYTRFLCELGERQSAADYAEALGVLAAHAAEALERVACFDLLLTPTLTAPPLPVGALRGDDGYGCIRAMLEWAPYLHLFSLTGMPAASLPLWRTVDDLPVGVQVGARVGADDLLFSVMAQLEGAQPWGHLHPPVWHA